VESREEALPEQRPLSKAEVDLPAVPDSLRAGQRRFRRARQPPRHAVAWFLRPARERNPVRQCRNPDAKARLRPAFVFDNMKDVDLFRIKVPPVAGSPVLALHNVSNLSVRMCSGVDDTQLKTAANKTL
jgi:hypothetical protein